MRMWFGAALAGAMLVAAPAQAALVVQFTEFDLGVAAIVTGTFDPVGLTAIADQPLPFSGVAPAFAATVIQADGSAISGYAGLTGPASWGSGLGAGADAGAGTGFALGDFGSGYAVFLPVGYVPTDNVFGVAVYQGATFASLGLTEGDYVYTAPGDTITVRVANIVVAAPEPAAWGMMIVGFGIAGGALRRTRRLRATRVTIGRPRRET